MVALVAVSIQFALPRMRDYFGPCRQVGRILKKDLDVPLAAPRAALDETLIGSPGDAWDPEANFSEDLELASRSAGDIERIQVWRQALAARHFTRGWRQRWISHDATSGAITVAERVYEFHTNEDARSFQRWASEEACDGARKAFTVPELAGAVGLSWVYPADDQTVEQVSFVLGNRRFLVVVGSVHVPDRTVLLQVTRYAVNRVSTVTIDGEPCREIRLYAAEAARVATKWTGDPIKRLEPLIPTRPPLGFSLVSAKADMSASGFSRTWTDGVSVLRSSVTQFDDSARADAWLVKDTAGICERAAAVEDSPQIQGSVFVVDQESRDLIQHIVFVRGSRGYLLELIGPPSETPGEILRTLASRSAVVAR